MQVEYTQSETYRRRIETTKTILAHPPFSIQDMQSTSSVFWRLQYTDDAGAAFSTFPSSIARSSRLFDGRNKGAEEASGIELEGFIDVVDEIVRDTIWVSPRALHSKESGELQDEGGLGTDPTAATSR